MFRAPAGRIVDRELRSVEVRVMTTILNTRNTLPEPPEAALSLRGKLKAVREYHTGSVTVRDTTGPVAMLTIGPRGLFPRGVMVSSPQGARDVLGGTSEAIDKEGLVHVQNRLLLGSNLFNLPHAQWKPRRRTLQPVFTKKHVADFAGHMADTADGLAREWAGAGQIDLDQEARRLTLRVLGRSLFGYDLGERAYELGPHLRYLLNTNLKRAVRPIRAPLWLPTPARWRFRRSRALLHAIADEAIDRARRSGTRNAELIHQLLEATDPETGLGLTDEQIRDELGVFLVAGHDTTATTLAYTLWQLGRHPEIQDRVAAEVRGLGSRELTAADVRSLPYTCQVLHEAMRLCPPAAGVGRLATADIAVDGYRVEAGTQILVGIWALHHDRAIWGEDVEEFDPGRFSAQRSAGRGRWTYLPFGAGPRSCIGDHFAMLEATIALATIVRAVDIESLEPDFPIAVPFTTTAAGRIPARIRTRGSVYPALTNP
jgi:cytochrome P450